MKNTEFSKATYFAMFYAAINMGSMISTVATPYLRRVECMGDDSCFSLAFGLPAVLMFIAICKHVVLYTNVETSH